MSIRRITLSPTIGRKSVIRRTKIRRRNDNRSPRNTPPEILHAPHLEARATDLPPLEQRRAQPRRRLPVPCLLQVAVAARAADHVPRIGGGVVGGVRRSPLRLELL